MIRQGRGAAHLQTVDDAGAEGHSQPLGGPPSRGLFAGEVLTTQQPAVEEMDGLNAAFTDHLLETAVVVHHDLPSLLSRTRHWRGPSGRSVTRAPGVRA